MSDRIKKPEKGGQGPAWAVKATDDDDHDDIVSLCCVICVIYGAIFVVVSCLRTFLGFSTLCTHLALSINRFKRP